MLTDWCLLRIVLLRIVLLQRMRAALEALVPAVGYHGFNCTNDFA
jgi:hypothetical protein